MRLPIIFSHYEVSDYLFQTLQCATLTNSSSRRVLLGDRSNRSLAEDAGWEHVDEDKIRSALRSDFLEHFQEISGKDHQNFKNGSSWLRYVSERWFIVEGFCRQNGIDRFWHFDSDTMIVEDLSKIENKLVSMNITHTTQSFGCALSGYITIDMLTEYCRFMVSIYRDEDKAPFRKSERDRVDRLEPGGALTEIIAYIEFDKERKLNAPHLERVLEGWWFDDCICQSHGLEMTRMNFVGRLVKEVEFDGNGFYGIRDGKREKFATINCSWVPNGIFAFILRCVESRSEGKLVPRSLSRQWLGLRHFILAGGRRLCIYLKLIEQ